MANTYVAISTVTVGVSGQATISFASIPATYTDLHLRLSLKTNRTTDYVDDYLLKFNGSTAGYFIIGYANYNGTMRGDRALGTSRIFANAATASNASQTADTFGNADLYFTNYASATNYKSGVVLSVTEQNSNNIWSNMQGNLWGDTPAISSLTLVPDVGTLFTQHSTATLYGIKNS